MPRAAQWLCMAHAARRHALHGASILACILRPYTFRKGRLPTVVSGEHTCAHTGQCRSTYSAKTGLAISMKYSLRCGATAVSELARACRLGLARCMLQPYCAPLRRAAANRVWCHAAAGCGRTSFRAKSSGLRSRRCVRSSAAALLSAVASAAAPVSAESNGSAVLAHGSAAKPTVAQYSGAACYFGTCNRLQTTPVSARACADLSRDRIRRAIRRTLRSRAIRAYAGRCFCVLSDALGMFAAGG